MTERITVPNGDRLQVGDRIDGVSLIYNGRGWEITHVPSNTICFAGSVEARTLRETFRVTREAPPLVEWAKGDVVVVTDAPRRPLYTEYRERVFVLHYEPGTRRSAFFTGPDGDGILLADMSRLFNSGKAKIIARQGNPVAAPVTVNNREALKPRLPF